MSAAPVNNPESPTMITQGFETQQVQTNGIQQEELPVRKLKVFGRLQIFLGGLLVILSKIRLILDTISMQKYKDCLDNEYYSFSANYDNSYHPYYLLCNRHYNTKRQLAFDITSLICSEWKTAFMVCNIIAASVLVPGIYILGVIEAVIRDTYESRVVILLSFMTVVSSAEVIVAIMAASYCCCCSTWGTSDQQGVVFVNGTQPELFLDLQTNIGNFQPPMDNTGHIDIPTVSYPRANQYQENTTNEQIEPHIQTVEGTLTKIDSTQQEVFDTNPLS
ncbi:unnamed protein product [Mytilus coruscus]|uniref:Uncharacterized protein n=1 Tax=Mytilus coruscus TaxID=42192 RepID=A0A6J8F1E5_MYTCO|nr:unnamed protein product [Mytilus coruscus]